MLKRRGRNRTRGIHKRRNAWTYRGSERRNAQTGACRKYALDICNGLVFIHSLGIIHRDIKPSNIIITEQGEAVIIDFGIARLTDDSKYADTKNLGTAGYAAPEQFGIYQSGPVTDIYAVGVLLNELLLGVHPTIDTPKGKLGKVINKCIMAQMSKRYQNVSELAEVLNKLL